MPDSSRKANLSAEFEQVKWIEEIPYPILRLQSDNLHNEPMATFPSQSKIAPIHPRIAPFFKDQKLSLKK